MWITAGDKAPICQMIARKGGTNGVFSDAGLLTTANSSDDITAQDIRVYCHFHKYLTPQVAVPQGAPVGARLSTVGTDEDPEAHRDVGVTTSLGDIPAIIRSDSER